MQIAPLPENEAQRLESLASFEVMDTLAEKVYDDIVKLLSEFCDVPIALISLIDENRQWFKASVGLSAKETPRDMAFCAHAILDDGIFEVPDTFMDERFCDNPLVLEHPNIRFYAGAPLVTVDGFKLGTLCAISDKPKSLNAQQKSALESLANAVVTQFELRKQARILKQEKEKAEWRAQLLDAIEQAQSHFIKDVSPQRLFSDMLAALLALTNSEYGFIGEVRYTEDKKPFLKTRAITNIAWNKETMEFFEQNAPEGLEFFNLNTLFGRVLTTQKTHISNQPAIDPHAGGIPEGHPDLNHFAGIPFFNEDRFVGMVGIANKPDGYSEQDEQDLAPFLRTCGTLIAAYMSMGKD